MMSEALYPFDVPDHGSALEGEDGLPIFTTSFQQEPNFASPEFDWNYSAEDEQQTVPDPGEVTLNDFFLNNGAWRPVEPCSYCLRMRLQCFMLQTTAANPNPVTSCSSCVALFRQCSLAERSKRQPLEFDTSQPVIGHLHGVNEESSTMNNVYESSGGRGDLVGWGIEVPSKRASSRSVTKTRALRTWFASHPDHPYPTEDEKVTLSEESGMSMTQVINWFTNARRRRRQSARAVSKQTFFPQGSPLPQMSPLERWRSSPPEDESVSAVSLENALRDLLDPMDNPESGDSHGNASSASGHSGYAQSQTYASSNSASSSYSLQSNASAALLSHAGSLASDKPALLKQSTRPKSSSHSPFQCSFCHRNFRKKFDWNRHERTVHGPGTVSWVCAVPLAPDQSFSIWRISCVYPECVFCGHESPDDAHFRSHEFESCAERVAQERTFSRKDHMWQHLRKFHGCCKWDGWTPDLNILLSECMPENSAPVFS